MRTVDLIQRKRDGEELSPEEIEFLVDGYTRDEIPDYQMAAFVMAVYFSGMTDREVSRLTECMLRSGETVSRRIHAARGSLVAPLADVELATKLRELAAYGGSGVAAQPLIDTLWRFDSATDAGSFMRLACAVASA